MEIGHYHTLEIVKVTDFGLILADEEEDVLLPNRYVTEEMTIGGKLKVFIYNDSEDRIVATTEEPYATVGEFGWLRINDVTPIGAFADIGLQKDLLIPYNNQDKKLQKDQYYIVYVYLDETTERLVGSTRINKFLKSNASFEEGKQVNILIGNPTDIGYFALVEQAYPGILYKDELYRKVEPGEKHQAYIKQVREDGKIDLTLEKPGYSKVESNSNKILEQLRENNGFLPFNDKSDPKAISEAFPMSKKTFKKAIGALYKQRLIEITEKGIRLKNG